MATFKRKHIDIILSGRKTQTRRTHTHTWKVGRTYALRDRWFSPAQAYILITRKFRQKLGDISQEDIKKEGYPNLQEFRKAWEEINGAGTWNPDLVVTVYEFQVCSRTGKPSSAGGNQQSLTKSQASRDQLP